MHWIFFLINLNVIKIKKTRQTSRKKTDAQYSFLSSPAGPIYIHLTQGVPNYWTSRYVHVRFKGRCSHTVKISWTMSVSKTHNPLEPYRNPSTHRLLLQHCAVLEPRAQLMHPGQVDQSVIPRERKPMTLTFKP